MDIKELNERIEQLTNLVKTSGETINQLEEALKLVEQERDRLADKRRELEPKFERVPGERYYYLDNFGYRAVSVETKDDNLSSDIIRFKANNYFLTRERAREVYNKIDSLLKLERLHDTYCPDYIPDWDSLDKKYSVYYNHDWHKYICSECTRNESAQLTYFPTAAIAQKVRDILNKENGITTEE